MNVLSFDLSTRCVGVVAAMLNEKGEISVMRSCPIIPQKFDVTANLGFQKNKKKIPMAVGKDTHNAWCYPNELFVPKSAKRERDVKVREAQNKFYLESIGRQIEMLMQGVRPDLVLVERNAMFNGILTIELLARLMGVLTGITAAKGIPLQEYKVATVRAPHHPATLVAEYSKRHSQEHLRNLDDVTKAALRELMQKKYEKYGLVLHSDDEGDACVVFDYWHAATYK